jgi:hypothetical protein
MIGAYLLAGTLRRWVQVRRKAYPNVLQVCLPVRR